jgi:pyruvate dehydrogenase E2 component (dihydrolipoamide acetyltransferase)
MANDILMPNLGFDTQEGKLVEWLKKPGDAVEKGEAIAIVESDKANVELESVAAGVVLEQLFGEGENIAVGAVIARVGNAAVAAGITPAPELGPTPSPLPEAAAAPIEISPLARRLAAEHDLDLSRVAGSGPRGRIRRSDVEAHLAAGGNGRLQAGGVGATVLALPKVRQAAREAGVDLSEVTPSGAQGQVTAADLQAYLMGQQQAALLPADRGDEAIQEIALSRTRQIIGERLGASMREAPHFYVTGEFDMEAALQRLASMPYAQAGINDLLQYLVVQALQRVPELNATFSDGRYRQYSAINLAIAIARPDGLITPVIPGAQRYSLSGLAAESRDLVARARANRLRPEDLQSGTFTISNLGVVTQVAQFTAVINPPQVAIVAAGAVAPRPVVADGVLLVRRTVHLTLSGDHRVVDGMHLGRFMAAFQEALDHF